MESVYLETTFISYLVARSSRELLVAAHQQATQEWWANRRGEFDNFVSEVVTDEASVGDPAEVQKRLAIIAALPALQMTEDAESLTQAIMAATGIGVIQGYFCRRREAGVGRPTCTASWWRTELKSEIVLAVGAAVGEN